MNQGNKEYLRTAVIGDSPIITPQTYLAFVRILADAERYVMEDSRDDD
jgi:hypothetical protein